MDFRFKENVFLLHFLRVLSIFIMPYKRKYIYISRNGIFGKQLYFVIVIYQYHPRPRRGRDRTVVGFTTTNVPMQLVIITTNVVSSNLAQGSVYSIQHYMIKFVCAFR